MDFKKTISTSVSSTGIGLFSGVEATVRLQPAPLGTGLVFKRIDLPGEPEIPALIQHADLGPRCTRLSKDGASVQTVEHLLSALHAYGIDNLIIEVNADELPAGDGSARFYVDLVEKARICLFDEEKTYCSIERPVSFSEGDTHIVAIPAKNFQVSYTLYYPHSKFLNSQYHSYVLNPDTYKEEIAPCRTFSLYEDIEPMLRMGLLKNAGLKNGVVIKNDKVVNPEGVRFSNEMARHKILDLIGDLSLVGIPLKAHIISIRSGHPSNLAFSKKLFEQINRGQLNG